MIILLTIIFSCGESLDLEPEIEDDEIVLSDETIIIEETNLSEPDIDSTGTFYSYTFTGEQPDINIGDVIVGETEYGYLRKVTNIEVQRDGLILETEQSCLTDAIEECSIKDSIQLIIGNENKLNGMYCTYLAKGVSVVRGGLGLDNTTLFSGTVGGVTISATIPEGYVSFEPYLNRELEIGLIPPRVEHLLLSAEGTLEFDCDLQLNASASIDYGNEKLLAIFISPPFPIGPVPCFVELSFVAGFETQLDVEGTIKSGFDSEASIELGAVYNYGSGWDDIWNTNFEINSHPIEWELTGDVYAKGYITPQLSLKVAGVLGPYMELEPYLKFDGNVIVPTSWEWELLGGVDANLGFEIEILSFSLADFYTTLANWEITIASDNGLYDYITVTSPNGGEVWYMGSTYEIQWNDNINENVKIELYKSGAIDRLIKDSTPSNGSYNWPIPTDLTEYSSYKIKISSTSSSVNDLSDNNFTIEEEPPADYITVTSPNGGETWQMGTTHNITWDDNISEDVKIELYISGTLVSTIAYDTSSGGSYTWSIPTWLDESSYYKIKIESVDNSSLNDWSDNYFTIEEGGGTGTVTDIDGNVYQTIIIGDQEWMAENLKVTHYRNGDPIPHLTNDDDWTGTSSGAYCVYDNDPSHADTYGNHYNWYTVDDSRGLAPEGWHVPSDTEIMELETYLGMSQSQVNSTGWRGTNEGSKLASGYDLWDNGALRDDTEFGSSGFDFFPGGDRNYNYGNFYGVGSHGLFWSSTENNTQYAWSRGLDNLDTGVERIYFSKRYGFSVRCVRD